MVNAVVAAPSTDSPHGRLFGERPIQVPGAPQSTSHVSLRYVNPLTTLAAGIIPILWLKIETQRG